MERGEKVRAAVIVAGWARDGGAALRPVASVPSGGDDPCHILIWPDGRRLSVANYSSGSLAVFDVLEGGAAARRSPSQRHARGGAGPRQLPPDRA